MKRSIAVWGIGLIVSSGLAGVPSLMNYQGRLTDGGGIPVGDDTYTVVFTIYDATSGGNSKWTETRSVTTTNGLFSILLGLDNLLKDTVFSASTRYLGIAVGGDPELSPRIALVTVPYAFQSSKSDSSKAAETAVHSDSTDAITDGGIDLADIGQSPMQWPPQTALAR